MASVPQEDYNYLYGFLRTCIDQRFVASTRAAFEKASGLRPAEYWHEAYAGGAAVPPLARKAKIMQHLMEPAFLAGKLI